MSASSPPPAAPPTGHRVGVRSLVLMIEAMRKVGGDVPALLERAGIDEAALEDPDARIPEDEALALWSAAEEQIGDPNLGLHMGECVTLEQLDVLGYLIRAASDGMEAGALAAEFVPIFTDSMQVELALEGEHFVVRQRWAHPHQEYRQLHEFLAVLTLVISRELVGDEILPIEVHFTHPAPADVSEHERITGAKVRFGMAVTALVFRAADAQGPLPIPTADPGLSEILERHARQMLEQLPPVNDFVADVRRLLAEELDGGDPSAEHIAVRLGMSVRTLRRKLDESGTGHKALLDGLRRELALRYLGDARLEISEVAYRLGFSEPSAFHRAFKRWTGRTPAEERAASRPG